MASARRFYLPPDQFAADHALCEGDAAHRLVGVLRLRAGDAVHVFDGCGHERAARVAEVTPRRVKLALLHAIAPLAEPPVPVTLACAFPRGSRGDWIVEKATELGVSRIVPIAAGRAVLAPGDGRIERWRRIAIEAAEQCGRAVVPEIGGDAPPEARMLVADPRAAPNRRAALAGVPAPAGAVFVGPEGGWSDGELDALIARGGTTVSLGPRTLRVETAAIVAVAIVIDATGAADGAS
ncbi:MAG: RsmE family RNA methyltransferase [Dehalococcoidia bacterium]